MPTTWNDVSANLNDLVETTLREGPQIVSREGVDTVVVLSIEEWNHLKPTDDLETIPRRSLKDILLDPNGPHDLDVPDRGRYKSRLPVEFD